MTDGTSSPPGWTRRFLVANTHTLSIILKILLCTMQVLQEAQAIDHKYEQGQSIAPLCGLVYVMKDL